MKSAIGAVFMANVFLSLTKISMPAPILPFTYVSEKLKYISKKLSYIRKKL
jgi:hypothetical protein